VCAESASIGAITGSPESQSLPLSNSLLEDNKVADQMEMFWTEIFPTLQLLIIASNALMVNTRFLLYKTYTHNVSPAYWLRIVGEFYEVFGYKNPHSVVLDISTAWIGFWAG
jgi:hypothetical protein